MCMYNCRYTILSWLQQGEPAFSRYCNVKATESHNGHLLQLHWQLARFTSTALQSLVPSWEPRTGVTFQREMMGKALSVTFQHRGASSKSVAWYLARLTISVARSTRSVATLLLWFSCTIALDQ